MAEQQQNRPLFGLNIDPSANNLQLAYNLAQIADSTRLDFLGIQDHPYNGRFLDTWTLLTASAPAHSMSGSCLTSSTCRSVLLLCWQRPQRRSTS